MCAERTDNYVNKKQRKRGRSVRSITEEIKIHEGKRCHEVSEAVCRVSKMSIFDVNYIE